MKATHCSHNATKYWVGVIFLLLVALAATVNAQDSSSASKTVLSKVIGSKGGIIEIPGRVRVAFPRCVISFDQTFSRSILNKNEAVESQSAMLQTSSR
jgi:hypothetical protein